jgi:hydroxyacylglutathione hydrolase
MDLIALPAFADNDVWMLHDGQRASVADPGDAAPVPDALDAHALMLAAILVTHRDPDHVGAGAGLPLRLRGAVFGQARERIRDEFTPLRHDACIDVAIAAQAQTCGALRKWKSGFR